MSKTQRYTKMITKQNYELIDKIKKSNVSKDKKWVYSLMAWMIKNQDADIVKVQRRIQVAIHYAKGNYKDYWNNEKNIEKHKLSQAKWDKANLQKKRNISTKWRLNANATYNLYKNGALSNESENIISERIN